MCVAGTACLLLTKIINERRRRWQRWECCEVDLLKMLKLVLGFEIVWEGLSSKLMKFLPPSISLNSSNFILYLVVLSLRCMQDSLGMCLVLGLSIQESFCQVFVKCAEDIFVEQFQR
jgi:hypothetical protein